MRSVTSALPSTLSQRVTRTLVAGKYICILRALPSLGLSENSPPFSGSSKAAKTVGLSSEGQHIKSIVPSKATSAAVLRLPMMPWSPIARCAAGLVSIKLCMKRFTLRVKSCWHMNFGTARLFYTRCRRRFLRPPVFSARNIGRRAPIDLGIVGDVSATLSALLPALEQKRDGTHLSRARAHYAQTRASLDALAPPGSKQAERVQSPSTALASRSVRKNRNACLISHQATRTRARSMKPSWIGHTVRSLRRLSRSI